MKNILLLLMTLLTVPALATDKPKQLSISFGAQTLEIAGVTPGATVFIYGLARESHAWVANIVPRETRLTDDDHNGAIAWNFEKNVPLRSVWFAVELGSGKYAAAAPNKYPARAIDLTSTHVARNSSGAIEEVSFSGSLVDCVVVRPANGNIWGATVAAHSSGDRSTAKRRVTFLISDLQGRQGTSAPAPSALDPNDVLFVLNSFQGEYGVAMGGL